VPEDNQDSPAPGRLAVIQDLANSFDVRRGRDDLATPGDAERWLGKHRIAVPATGLTTADLDALHGLRAALRRLLLANNGGDSRTQDLDVLNGLVRDSGLRPTFGPGCAVDLEIPTTGFVASLATIVAIVLKASSAGTWSRLKACPQDACNYTFYDRTKNHSRTWCSMSRCGSQAKMRTYRARQRTSVGSDTRPEHNTPVSGA
jgi:predicted RNA-binding Zn ribbon-like protein